MNNGRGMIDETERHGIADPTDLAAAELVRRRDKDVLFGLFLVAGSCALIIYAIRISFQAMEAVKAVFYVAPGFPILVVASCLGTLGCVLVAIAVRQGGTLRWLRPASIWQRMRTRSSLQTAAVFVYLFLYMCVLWDRVPLLNVHIPFVVTTFLFLCAMMITFQAARIRYVVIISVVATAIIVAAFQYLAEIPLP